MDVIIYGRVSRALQIRGEKVLCVSASAGDNFFEKKPVAATDHSTADVLYSRTTSTISAVTPCTVYYVNPASATRANEFYCDHAVLSQYDAFYATKCKLFCYLSHWSDSRRTRRTA